MSMDDARFLNVEKSPIFRMFSLRFSYIFSLCAKFSRIKRENNTQIYADFGLSNVEFEEQHIAVRNLILLPFHSI